MKEKELHIMNHLRQNAREKLTKMSRATGIPVSTIYEHLKGFEGELIKKHTCILDFEKLGYDLRVTILLKARQDQKQAIRTYLTGHHQVNTVCRINNGYDFLTEAVFTNMAQLQTFVDELDAKGVKKRQEYYVLEEVTREAFLSNNAHIELFLKQVE